MRLSIFWLNILLILNSNGNSLTPGKCLYDDVLKDVVTRRFFVDEYELPLRIEVTNRISHQLLSHILKILLNEVTGYPLVYLIKQDGSEGSNAVSTLQKISSCDTPENCTKVDDYGPEIMINVEVWLAPGFNLEGWVETGEVEVLGPLGPVGRSGWFVNEYIVTYFWEANNTIIDHWKAFTDEEIVKEFIILPGELDPFTLKKRYCFYDDCENGVYSPPICKTSGIKCATLLADFPASNYELLKNEILNLKLLVSVVWVGDLLEKIVEDRTLKRKKTVFFHKKPMYLESSNSKFNHVSFPSCEDNRFNPCEVGINQLSKIAWTRIKSHAPHAFHVLKSLFFTQSDYIEMLQKYAYQKSRGLDIQYIACEWLRNNRIKWNNWIPPNNNNKTNIYLGGIFPLSGLYFNQSGIMTAAKMAADAINKDASILGNYTLTILVQDGHCAADEVMKSFINYVTNDTYKSMVGILGPACSDTVEPIAGVAKHFNTIIMSYSAEGAVFSNRDKYPYFFRTIPENNQFRFVYLKLFQKLGYTRVAALTEDGQKYPEYISYLQDSMQSNGMTFLVNRKFPRDREYLDMKPYLQELKEKGAKIIIGDFFDYAARAVMCAAYQMEMTAANGYVWFLPLWFTSNWYDTDKVNSAAKEEFERVDCTTKQMISAIDGHMSLAYKFYADNDSIMQKGITVGEWLHEYKKIAKKESVEVSHYGGYAYDAVWVYANALDTLFKENNSHIATLHSSKTSRRLVELLNETNFDGVTGPLYFLGSSRISDVNIYQWLNYSYRKIGVYHPSSQTEGELDFNESNVIWRTSDGRKPEDGSKVYSSCTVEVLRSFFGVSCGAAIGIANVMGILLLVIPGMAGFVIYKRRYEKRMKITEARMKELGLMASSGPLALDEWEMPRDHIVINRKLGEGAFGNVYGGEAHLKNKGWISVAVKTLKNGAKPEEKLDFLSEAEIMKQFDHINIVKLVGVCTMGEPVYTVMEFMLYDDLNYNLKTIK
ncbi:hypothetical protein JTE90_021827 [Oedothorax gibbosus]|uniref:receptor protein-tyrosine kinase n=1 Tax=Oedothorax gibbosus TaxID=931172 RepID=A0AAV6V0M3_9ARAC|nr:hypothetical protein JTE90_021827 [Oedothorax gibbosus]